MSSNQEDNRELTDRELDKVTGPLRLAISAQDLDNTFERVLLTLYVDTTGAPEYHALPDDATYIERRRHAADVLKRIQEFVEQDTNETRNKMTACGLTGSVPFGAGMLTAGTTFVNVSGTVNQIMQALKLTRVLKAQWAPEQKCLLSKKSN